MSPGLGALGQLHAGQCTAWKEDESVGVYVGERAGSCSRLLGSQSKMVPDGTQKEPQGEQQKEFYPAEQILNQNP